MQDNGVRANKKRIESALLFHLVINLLKHYTKSIKRSCHFKIDRMNMLL